MYIGSSGPAGSLKSQRLAGVPIFPQLSPG